MQLHRPAPWVGALILAASLVGSAQAQRISLAPDVGVYIPTTELIAAASGEQFKQEIGMSFGGRFGLWFSNRVGVQLTGTYVPSDLRYSFTGGETTEGANLWFGSGRVSVAVIPVTSPVYVVLSGGVSVVGRSGTAYEGVEDRSDVGGVAGATVGINLGPVSLFVNADDNVYKASFSGTTAVESKTQHDVNLSFGFGVPLGASRKSGKEQK